MKEAKNNRKEQKSGDYSTNIQAETIVTGLDYDSAKSIALDVFNSNFLRLAGLAVEEAVSRAEKATKRILDEFFEHHRDRVNIMQEPSFQHNIYTIQKEYAKTADDNLLEMLIDILGQSSYYEVRDRNRIILNESLETAAKLTTSELAALSIIFLLDNPKYITIDNTGEFSIFVDQLLTPFVPNLIREGICYRHIAYTGCGTITVGNTTLEDLLLSNYPHLFPDFSNTSGIIYDEGNEKAFGKFLLDYHECFSTLLYIWDNSLIAFTQLTSVGIAIAQCNIKLKTGKQFDIL